MKFLTKIFGYFGGAALAAGQFGLLGTKWSPIVGAIGAGSLAVAAHAASNSGPNS